MENVWLNPEYKAARPITAVFADRDGTLIRHVDYISDPDQVELLEGVYESVHQLLELKIPLFILTNQSGVGRGYFTIDKVYACQEKLFKLLDIPPSSIAGWCIAPEAPGTEGGYRKPSTRFIDEACAHLDVDAKHTHMIGDTMVDLETAWNAHAHPWAVGCGKPELPEIIKTKGLDKDFSFLPSFSDTVQQILKTTVN